MRHVLAGVLVAWGARLQAENVQVQDESNEYLLQG
jgi:hypothetical protein